ncbi:MAG TPA: deoxyribose-phosphate aldolase [Pirellulales bacterium]|jgi:deoxyribose-phosphate aldolase|nr:deoxyribose-phosphate aldolase [Pirellulales bacterium]
MNPTFRDLAKMIDHSLLHPTMTDEQIKAGCLLAREFDVASACVKPYSVPQAAELLAGTEVLVCAVAGFPHGNSHTDLKLAEAEWAIIEGAAEIDIVVNIGKVLGGQWNEVSAELKAINEACVDRGVRLKVIFENDYLLDSHIIRLCEICSEHQVAFVKTSTGYGFVKQPDGSYNYKGATEHHLRLMREHSAKSVQIKAAGGIRTLDELLRCRAAGATRIGASATESILREAIARGYGPVPESLRGVAIPAASPTAGY